MLVCSSSRMRINVIPSLCRMKMSRMHKQRSLARSLIKNKSLLWRDQNTRIAFALAKRHADVVVLGSVGTP
jgi:hypothetical protein